MDNSKFATIYMMVLLALFALAGWSYLKERPKEEKPPVVVESVSVPVEKICPEKFCPEAVCAPCPKKCPEAGLLDFGMVEFEKISNEKFSIRSKHNAIWKGQSIDDNTVVFTLQGIRK